MRAVGAPTGGSAGSHGELMDRIYGWQRHIYDLTRKYYLLGRDRAIAELALSGGASVLEIGCGTGRNLALIGRRWPGAMLHGIDLSNAMLKTASAKLGGAARLAAGDATSFDPHPAFGRDRFDCIVMSYCTSMIPAWREAVAHGLTLLAPGGALHIVDFGGMGGMPAPFRALLRAWLARFHVTPRGELVEFVRNHAAHHGLVVDVAFGPGGYYQKIIVRRT